MRLLAALVCVVMLQSAVNADDKCLSGASTLSDQRDLASLRTATDTACPCPDFTGAPGATRGAYLKCARNVVKEAVAAGTLRQACKSTANAINKGAVCGTTKVACGRFKPTARTPLSCRLKSAASCKNGRTFEENACTDQTHCADVLDWTAATCIDVRQNGPFTPGVRVVRFTKKSVVNPSENRVLDTVIWYPSLAGAEPLDPAYGAALNAPLDNSQGPYPLVMFSHGSCGLPTQAIFLTPFLASYGLVIVAPPHPGNTLAELATCGTNQELLDSARERPQDILFVLDAMLAANGDPLSPFFGSIDDTKLGMSGHSFGGFTTYVTTSMDARFSVAMSFAAFAQGVPPLTIPSLTMLGDIDSVVSNDAIEAAYGAGRSPKYLVDIQNTGHFAWSDLCFPTPDCQPPATLTQDEAHAIVRRWVLPFLKVYLQGDTRFTPFLAPTSVPGVVIDAQP